MNIRHYDITTGKLLDSPPNDTALTTGWYWVAQYEQSPVLAHHGYQSRTGDYGWQVCGSDGIWRHDHWYYRSANPLLIPTKPERST